MAPSPMITDPHRLNTVLVTDCGSTTTKALLFQKTESGWRKIGRGEAPTTVEKPVANVTVGALNAFTEIQEVTGRSLLNDDMDKPFVITGNDPTQGIDLYLSTSSAGGGLQMMVTGVVKEMTTESASRAALGAGAIVMDAFSADDVREDYERIERIRHLRPDIVLMTGGVDGGDRTHVIENAEILLSASPRPRFGSTLTLPVIYAGNREAADEVREILSSIADISVVENVRPSLDRENLGPAREAIHEFFLTHVMSHSPGYGSLLSWTPVPVMPTPAAVGDMVLGYATRADLQVLCVDIGGATTDVFSVFKNSDGERVFNRTVSANLGMSYSIANVLIEAGAENISRWLPIHIGRADLHDRLRNKMIRPTSIPQTQEDLWLEHAVCREALRLSLEHHRSLAVGLSGVQQQRGIADIFSQTESRYQLVDMMKLDLVIGSGGVLSHAPNRLDAALMMIDGFGLQGLTQIAVDSIFMMPHLGVLASVHDTAADEIFLADCLINVGHAICPIFKGPTGGATGGALVQVLIDGDEVATVIAGQVDLCEVEAEKTCSITLIPLKKEVNVGAGPGREFSKEIVTGSHGLILDGRGRPLHASGGSESTKERQREVYRRLSILGEGTS